MPEPNVLPILLAVVAGVAVPWLLARWVLGKVSRALDDVVG
jgi:hypothetical protein